MWKWLKRKNGEPSEEKKAQMVRPVLPAQQVQKTKQEQKEKNSKLWSCPECGKANLKGKYCPECGRSRFGTGSARHGQGSSPESKTKSKEYRFCPSCWSRQLTPESRYCPNCGKMFMKQIRAGQEKIVEFGRDMDDRSKRPLKWIVLEEKKGESLLLSLNPITVRPFDSFENHKNDWYRSEEYRSSDGRYANEKKTINNVNALTSNWRICEISKWLNNEFLKKSFYDMERSRIISKQLSDDLNPVYHTSSGKGFAGVFLLTIDELKNYQDKWKKKFAGSNSKKKGHHTSLYKSGIAAADSDYWLRTPGNGVNSASYVEKNGTIVYYGDGVDRFKGVRPAMWVNLSGIAVK